MMADVGQGLHLSFSARVESGDTYRYRVDSQFKQKEAWRHRRKKTGITTVVPALQAEEYQSSPQVMLSHGDEDHVRKLKTIAKHINIHQLIMGKGWRERIPLMQEMKKASRFVAVGTSGRRRWKWNERRRGRSVAKGLSRAENEDSIPGARDSGEADDSSHGDASEEKIGKMS